MNEQNSAQQQFREQAQVAETMVQNSVQAWNDLALKMTEMTFEATEKNLHYSQEALSTYRRLYEEGLQNWQTYVKNVGKAFTR